MRFAEDLDGLDEEELAKLVEASTNLDETSAANDMQISAEKQNS